MLINAKSKTDLASYHIIYGDAVPRERPGIYGISHLAEHLICTKIKDMEDELNEYAVYWNGNTGNERVRFYLSGLDDCVSRFAERFTKSILACEFSEEEFENERKIVLEEYKDAFNDQYWAHRCNLMRKLFFYHGSIGLRKDLESLTYETCRQYVAQAFGKPTKIVRISPSVAWPETQAVEFQKMDPIVHSHRSAATPDYETANTFEDKTSIIYASPVLTRDFAVAKFICTMLGFGLTSPLYDELREKRGLVYFVYCYLSRLTGSEGVVEIGTVTSNKNVSKVKSTICDVLGDPDRYLTRKRYETLLNYFGILRTKMEIELYANPSLLLTPTEWSIFGVIEGLSFDDVRDVYDRAFSIHDYHQSVDKEEFPSGEREER